MLERKTVKYKFKLTAVALANKVARIVFVLMTRGGEDDDDQLRPDDRDWLGKRNCRRKARLKIKGADKVM